ncbi:uncharacterized protein K452DRAFT_284380 [Aplosporella prunicola CBS 121167]|uniref:tRNA (guanine(26)-N(2))-dimethyltransferase n=1 Tax=Aplosporella prunicola CBS 121167 TaxID=1176127 RepID=A0A6A6BLJ9_9PEZI|nr:uncharacterized protein K452DRAFT_284380 [Aplosporella prunicola CBS 121167]KAF2144989.1 hypothetical protein K452DRAFT_284380 [Aplosporella prunicola CBS 121167]
MAESTSASSVPLSAEPRADQRVTHEGREYTTIKEGLAYILVPPNAITEADPKKAGKYEEGVEEKPSVFYNPIQQFNRDLSVLAIRAFGEDALAQKQHKHDQQMERNKKRKERTAKRKLEQAEKEKGAEGGEDGAEEQNGRKRQRTDDTGAGITKEPTGSADAAGASKDESAMFDDSVTKDQDMLAADGAAKPATEEDASATNGAPKGPRFRILDALSATGLRALRYAQEIPFVTSVTGNDLSPAATDVMKLNIAHNKLEQKITSVTGNALAHMYLHVGQEGVGGPGARYDVIDLDPYGTAVPFLDAAVQAVTDGGLLCVTCTDAGVFASTGYLEKTYSQYGGLPLKGHHSHEGGLRLILHAVATAAAKYGITIEPLLSLSIDFYARVFVRVRKAPAEVKFLAGKTMIVYNCDSGCGAWTTQYLARNVQHEGKKGLYYKHSFAQGPSVPARCPHCDFKTHLAGPMWGGPMHNPAFIEKILSYLPGADKTTYGTTERIEGMLRTAYEELLPDTPSTQPELSSTTGATSTDTATPTDELKLIPRVPASDLDRHPFFFIPSDLARILRCQSPSEAAVKGALRGLGYRATRSHTKPGTVKTDAPWAVVWEVMREWVRQRAPIKEGAIRELMPGWGVWQKRRELVVAKAAAEAAAAAAEGEAKPAEEARPAGEAKSATTTPENGGRRRLPSQEPGTPLHELKVVFDEQLGRDARESKKLVRYQMNPRANWGPMVRAK